MPHTIDPASAAPPRVSVVIPLYNKQATIRRAIASVNAQTFSDFELIVIDDGGTDGSADIARAALDPRGRLVSQANAGPGAARNAGAALSSAPFIAFLDADDEWRPDFLAAAVSALAAQPACIAWVCAYNSGDYAAVRPNKVRQLGLEGPLELPTDLAGDTLKTFVDAVSSSSAVVRRAAFAAAGGFFSENRCTFGEDSYLWLQVLLAGPVYWEPRELARMHFEDSALGFAVATQRQARPIALRHEQLRRACPERYRASLDRVVDTLVRIDVGLLARSGAFAAARDLRRLHGRPTRYAGLADRLRYLKFEIGRRFQRPHG